MRTTSIRLLVALGGAVVVGAVSCSDDDGANVQPNPPIGGSGGAGMSGAAGSTAGAGSGGMSGTGGAAGGMGGSGGSAGCTPQAVDAGAPDAGDAGPGDAGNGDAGGGDASTDGGDLGAVSFAADIHPIFVAHCGPCHASQNSGGHNVADPDVDVAYDDAVRESADVLFRTNGEGMPPSYADPPNDCASGDGPGDPGCLTVEEYALLQTWAAQCFPR